MEHVQILIVNGKSAIEWIVERYAVIQDKKSLIRNDANDWSREHHKPRYILDLLLSVINVSVQTVDIVASLPHLKFDWPQPISASHDSDVTTLEHPLFYNSIKWNFPSLL